ncbi:MAG: MFS transporter [Bacteroidetes bacterium]|nr:MFS transporter [Bacteroidota bacterium]
MIIKGNKKVINAWAMYDWANSAYSLTITSAIFPIYFTAVTTSNGSRNVLFLGRTFNADSLQTYAISLAFLVIAAINPLLSSIADYSGNKKKFMYFFSTLGAISCASLFFFKGTGSIAVGVFGAMFAAIGYAGSIVFYNAFLPEIAEPVDQDRVSAKGFAMGYIGSSLLLIFNLVMIQFPQLFFDVTGKINELMVATPSLTHESAAQMAKDFYSGPASRISFLSVGIWWFSFAQYTFAYLPNNVYNVKPHGRYIFNGYLELKKVWFELQQNSKLTRFLLSFFFYNMGAQTVMYVAALFGNSELKLKTSVLIMVILIIQFVAIGGAYLFSSLSKRFGNIRALTISIFIWILVAICAYFDDKRFGVDEQAMFILIAVIVGLVMGGLQSLSRSTYSKLLPETIDHASYFSFYDVCDKTGTVLGTFAFGFINELTGSMRNSILMLGSFFLIGIFLLLRVGNSMRKPEDA